MITSTLASMYSIIVFKKSSDVEIVPQHWIDKTGEPFMVHWPPYRSTSQVVSAIKAYQEPSQMWKKFAIRVLRDFG